MLVLTLTILAGIVIAQWRTGRWAALTTVPAAARPAAVLTRVERLNMEAKARELRADVEWCMDRSRALARKALRHPDQRTRLAKEADVFERAARGLADDAIALLDAAR